MKKETRHTRTSADFKQRTRAYLVSHAQAFFSSLGRLVRSPFTSFMTVIVLAIAITLATGFYLLVNNLQQLTGNIEASNQISLFLKEKISDEQGRQLAEKIEASDKVKEVVLISKQQALDEFQHYSGFGQALTALEKNPLPTVIQVLPTNTLNNDAELESLLASLQKYSEVDFAQFDMQWVKRLQSIMALAKRGAILLAIILAMAVLFISGNTIRLELHNRREEVVIAKLVGATNRFIQRPFLYIGFWYGFLAGVLAWVMITIIMLVLRQPIERLSELYNGDFDILFLTIPETMLLMIVSSLLGILGAWGVLVYQLQQLKP